MTIRALPGIMLIGCRMAFHTIRQSAMVKVHRVPGTGCMAIQALGNIMIDGFGVAFGTDCQPNMIECGISPGYDCMAIGTKPNVVIGAIYVTIIAITEGMIKGAVPVCERVATDTITAKMPGGFCMAGFTIGCSFVFK